MESAQATAPLNDTHHRDTSHHPYKECVGGIHVHTRYSDGAGAVPEIARWAARSGLRFVVVNDHDYMTGSLHLDEEGVYEGVLVLMGLEIGARYHHYLAMGLKEMVKGFSKGPQEVIDRVNALGGFGFLAHPFEKGMPFLEKSVAYTWNDLSVEGFTGICIWNFSSRWKERVRTALHALFFLAFKSRTLKGPSRETLAFWDRLCSARRVVGIGGSDAHGAAFGRGPFRFTPLTYGDALGAVTVHALLKQELPRDKEGAKAVVYEALREGRLYIAHERLNRARGFRFEYAPVEGPRVFMGQEAPFRPGVFHIRLPSRGCIRLVRDGERIAEWRGTQVSVSAPGPGVFRVEVYFRVPLFGWRPWIFSNPIYLRGQPDVRH